ncbi:MAG TPA: NAD-dependent epimerase/dehydratase family protein [Thermoleophilaceae bacterium]|nr:NAD-dependent epimerase/dehydratase family protein [Thermoleophilaceae bacterium]
MRALVTGGAGFIGSNVVDALLERGDDVTVVDDLSTGKRDNLEAALAQGAELTELDIRDSSALTEHCERVSPQVIFHLAAQIDVRKSVADPAFDSEVNVGGTINVLRAAEACGARVVNTSSGGAIYGEAKTIPAPEDHPVAPEAPYGLSKFCAEQYCELFARLHGTSTVSLRYGNVFGPRQDPLGEAGVIAIFCGKLLEGGRATVFGDGSQTRDYVYVGDVVEANLLAGSSQATGPFNIGRGEEVSVLDILESLSSQSGGGLEADRAPERPGEVQHIALETSRARQELGWEAKVGLDEGLELTLASLR